MKKSGENLVQWFGSHPSEGSVSMRVYREQLQRVCSDSSRFKISCWPQAGVSVLRKGRLRCIFDKRVAYQRRVCWTKGQKITHFLDHSCAHLIPSVGRQSKIVATLHDLIPLRFQGELSESQVRRFRRNVSFLSRCDAIISVSEYSKREAVELLGLREEKISVVPNGVSLFQSSDISEAGLVATLRQAGAQVVLLSVGSTLERKNLTILPAAIREASRVLGQRIGLLRVGASLSPKLRRDIVDEVGEGLLLEAGRLTDFDLGTCYNDVDVVIVPSLYEGFGLPVLEALGCGKPVASSDTTSLPEVGGEMVEYFSPSCGEDAGGAVARAFRSIERGISSEDRKIYAARFSWEQHLQGCFEVYNSLLSES